LEDRSKNIIVYGVKISQDEKVEQKVEKVLEEIGEKPLVRDCVRVGFKKSDGNSPRPIKSTLKNSDHVAQVLKNARRYTLRRGTRLCTFAPTEQQRRGGS
jgi:hypothetical protein